MKPLEVFWAGRFGCCAIQPLAPQLRHKWMDTRFANRRVVFETEPGHGLYLALGIEGQNRTMDS